MSNGLNVGSISERIFAPEGMEWEESKYAFLTGLLEREGGSKRVRDSGGWTRYGISEKTHGSDYVIWDLKEEDAREIYSEQYMPAALDRIGRNNVAFKFIDMNVNMGWNNATRVLQKALNTIPDINIEADGDFGPGTSKALVKAIDKFGEDGIIDAIIEAQLKYYRTREDYDKYPGWEERGKYNPIK